MTVRNSAWAVLMMAGVAAAQVAPTTPAKVANQLKGTTSNAQSKPAAPPSQAVATTPSKPAAATQNQAKPTASAPSKSPFSSKPASAQAAKASNARGGNAKPSSAKSAKAQPSAPAAQAAPAPEMAKASNGRRDPFISPIVRVATGPNKPPADCRLGKRCLTADDITLRGIVKSENGMIAVVENQANRTYFLHENDPLYNGVVVKITGDSVILRENGVDTFGKPTTHEVVKKVGPQA